MRKFLTVIARIIAAICAFFFVFTTLLALLLTTLNGQMFNSKLYKNALVKQNIYSRLPGIVASAITSDKLTNPCAQNPLACSMDGASPELQACLTTALGATAYQAIGSGARTPTSTELNKAQPCLDQYGSGQGASSQSGAGGSGMPSFMQHLTAADWQAMLTILLPPDTLKSMTESTLDQMFAYLNGEAPSVSVPLVAIKQRLLGASGTDLIMQLLNSQQPCSSEDFAQLTSGMSNGGMIFCKPPKDALPTIAALLPNLLNSFVSQIPDKATLINPPAPGAPIPGSGPFGVDPISTLRTIRLVMRLSPLFPLIFLLLVTIFAVRNIKSWMRWWGIPFFVTGLIALVLGVSIVPVLNISWTWFIAPRIPVFIPADIPQVGLELIRSILQTLSVWIIVPAAILFVIGLGAWIGSCFIYRKIKPEPTASTSAPTS